MSPIVIHLRARAPFCFSAESPISQCPVHALQARMDAAASDAEREEASRQIDALMAHCDHAYAAATEAGLNASAVPTGPSAVSRARRSPKREASPSKTATKSKQGAQNKQAAQAAPARGRGRLAKTDAAARDAA
jgi:hypothetical protein